MFLVLGSASDEHPQRLVDRWGKAGRDVCLVTPLHLSRPGWRLLCGRSDECSLPVGDRILKSSDLDGIVSALPWIGPHDVPHVVSADREYVAQEMAAFLLAWLTELDCPVLETPTPLSLAGSGRTPLEWAAIATSVGVPSAPEWAGPTSTVTVVGRRAVGDVGPALAAAAESVAAAAGCSLVTFHITCEGLPRVTCAEARPHVGEAPVADALLAWLESA